MLPQSAEANLLVVMAVLVVSTFALPVDTTVVLGRIEKDLTGDGVPEVLRLVGVGRTTDSLDVTFTIESAGQIVYQFTLDPLTMDEGFDGGRRVLSADEQQTRLRDFGRSFFADGKFQTPAAFLTWLRDAAPPHIAEIPWVIARDRRASDPRDAAAIWQGMLRAPVTIFTFSPGGDGVEAIGWSPVARRFFRLLDCC
jgi:hypothetical protein